MKEDIYQRVTDQIIEALEKGVRPWHCPWNAEHAAGKIARPLRGSFEPYRGINVLMLWAEAVARGFTNPVWMTFKQASALGAHVRKGERGTSVVYASTLQRQEEDPDTGDEIERTIPYLKAYTVFNAEQIEGLPETYHAKPAPELSPAPRHEAAESFIKATKAAILHGGAQASYNVGTDIIRMPDYALFSEPNAYYATLIHELTHWTRHPSRLARDFGRKGFGDAGYAMEELVAEIGSAFVLCDLGISLEPREEHASYISSWLSVLQNDKRAIFTAAAYAQRAAGYLQGLQD